MPPSADPDLYVNAGLGFEIRKPSHWTFLATPWAVSLRRRSGLSSEELRRVVEQATVPFVYAHLPHSDPESSFPTVQASCRVVPAQYGPDALMPQLLSQFQRQFPEFELLEATADAVVGGAKAVLVKCRFTVCNAEGTQFRCVSRAYTLFAGQLAFSVGLTCPAQGTYCAEDELESIARSIRVRRRKV